MISEKWRNLIGFWILGLCNNFAYVIMLSAAHDILKDQEQKDHVESHNTTTTPAPVNESYLECNEISTGAILLADILPTLIIKLTAPFFILHLSYKIRVLTCVLFSLASFLVVSYSTGIWMSIIGMLYQRTRRELGALGYLVLYRMLV